MATSKKKTGPRPKRSALEIEQKGLDAHTLAVEHRARIEERLPAGAIDGLALDLEAIGVVIPGAIAARRERKGATESQAAAAERARDVIMRIRYALASAKLPKSVRAEYGEGSEVDPSVVKTVIAAGEQILSRAATHPDELREAGILDRDLANLRAAVDGTRAADRTQEGRKKAQRDATAARDATLVRVESTVKRIAAAGQLEFGDELDVRRRFEALVAPRAKAGAKAPV